MSSNEFGCKNMVMETVRELSRLDSRELNRDTSGTRAYSLFLVELAERYVTSTLALSTKSNCNIPSRTSNFTTTFLEGFANQG